MNICDIVVYASLGIIGMTLIVIATTILSRGSVIDQEYRRHREGEARMGVDS